LAKLIKVSDSTYYKLADHGKWADSMDDIVKRLMKEAGFGRKNLTASGEHKG
jgi:predicted CopG family antitoxin